MAEEAVLFYRPVGPWGCFSNFSAHPVVVNGKFFKTSEHALMYKKAELMGDMETAGKILTVQKPGSAKALGRKIKPYDDAKWAAARFEVMVEILRQKARLHPEVRAALGRTGRRRIAEAAPRDFLWGIGVSADKAPANPKDWKGHNLLGRAWEQVRSELF
jgi:ribA/ribD-fused uncharacterized protein